MVSYAIRWSGLALIVGAVLLGAAIVMVSFEPSGSQSVSSPLISIPMFLASILLLLALPAMYAQQAEKGGWLGLAGHTLLETGMLIIFLSASTPLRFPSSPSAGENGVDFFLGVALTLGLLLTALASIRARVFPRAAGLLLLGTTAGFFFDFFVAEFLPPLAGQSSVAFLGVLMALAFAWFGAAMVRGAQFK